MGLTSNSELIWESRAQPTFGFYLFARHLLPSEKFKNLANSERDLQLSFLWNQMSEKDKSDYNTQAQKVITIY